jgi:hypothetical protein
MSSASDRPKEIVPSPIPFSPFSSSSRSRKLRGTRGWLVGLRVDAFCHLKGGERLKESTDDLFFYWKCDLE